MNENFKIVWQGQTSNVFFLLIHDNDVSNLYSQSLVRSSSVFCVGEKNACADRGGGGVRGSVHI